MDEFRKLDRTSSGRPSQRGKAFPLTLSPLREPRSAPSPSLPRAPGFFYARKKESLPGYWLANSLKLSLNLKKIAPGPAFLFRAAQEESRMEDRKEGR